MEQIFKASPPLPSQTADCRAKIFNGRNGFILNQKSPEEKEGTHEYLATYYIL